MQGTTVTWVDEKTVSLSGFMNESCDFQPLVDRFPAEVWIDFKGVTRINSCGVREWINAIRKTKAIIHFVNCSSVIVDQISMIPEFIGKTGIVESFATMLVCDECGHEESRRFERGKDEVPTFTPDGKLALPCPDCGAALELDQNPKVLEDFLKRSLQAAS